ncbi:hypothetical protein [Brunnivagina elsteri]|uniref:Uncharacterized protein n=1 Tax=Brunnivagina elsteri CCALA 953 TaxID=987040 RepID=A0A2A2TNT9_9CYAN|nr:hypothetical protein [Calothrix elsteri]PAX59798.1 hypothetical protein CK510_05320 [Calothrix elsteri CCALA 953]
MLEREINELRQLVEPYVNLWHLECDGLARVLHSILIEKHIEHTVWVGHATHDYEQMTTPKHFWIDLPCGLRIDYRLQQWIGKLPAIPHGIFNPKDFESVKYEGEIVELPFIPKELIDILVLPIEVPEEWLYYF